MAETATLLSFNIPVTKKIEYFWNVLNTSLTLYKLAHAGDPIS